MGTQDSYKLKAAEHVNVNKSVFCVSNVLSEFTVDDITAHYKSLHVRVLFCFDVSSSTSAARAFKLAIPTGQASIMNWGDQWPRRVTVRLWRHGVSSSVGLNAEASSVHSSCSNEAIIHVLSNDVQETDVSGYGPSATAGLQLPTSGDTAGEHISLSQTNRSTRTTDGCSSFTNNTLCVDVEVGVRNTRNGMDTVVNDGSSAGEFVVIHPTATALSTNSPTVVIHISGNGEDVDHT